MRVSQKLFFYILISTAQLPLERKLGKENHDKVKRVQKSAGQTRRSERGTVLRRNGLVWLGAKVSFFFSAKTDLVEEKGLDREAMPNETCYRGGKTKRTHNESKKTEV